MMTFLTIKIYSEGILILQGFFNVFVESIIHVIWRVRSEWRKEQLEIQLTWDPNFIRSS